MPQPSLAMVLLWGVDRHNRKKEFNFTIASKKLQNSRPSFFNLLCSAAESRSMLAFDASAWII
jgi:hypothetical protein